MRKMLIETALLRFFLVMEQTRVFRPLRSFQIPSVNQWPGERNTQPSKASTQWMPRATEDPGAESQDAAGASRAGI